MTSACIMQHVFKGQALPVMPLEKQHGLQADEWDKVLGYPVCWRVDVTDTCVCLADTPDKGPTQQQVRLVSRQAARCRRCPTEGAPNTPCDPTAWQGAEAAPHQQRLRAAGRQAAQGLHVRRPRVGAAAGAAAGPGAAAAAGAAVVAWRSTPSSAWRGCACHAVAERRACARHTEALQDCTKLHEQCTM